MKWGIAVVVVAFLCLGAAIEQVTRKEFDELKSQVVLQATQPELDELKTEVRRLKTRVVMLELKEKERESRGAAFQRIMPGKILTLMEMMPVFHSEAVYETWTQAERMVKEDGTHWLNTPMADLFIRGTVGYLQEGTRVQVLSDHIQLESSKNDELVIVSVLTGEFAPEIWHIRRSDLEQFSR